MAFDMRTPICGIGRAREIHLFVPTWNLSCVLIALSLACVGRLPKKNDIGITILCDMDPSIYAAMTFERF